MSVLSSWNWLSRWTCRKIMIYRTFIKKNQFQYSTLSQKNSSPAGFHSFLFPCSPTSNYGTSKFFDILSSLCSEPLDRLVFSFSHIDFHSFGQVARPHKTPLKREPASFAKRSVSWNIITDTPALKKINGIWVAYFALWNSVKPPPLYVLLLSYQSWPHISYLQELQIQNIDFIAWFGKFFHHRDDFMRFALSKFLWTNV